MPAALFRVIALLLLAVGLVAPARADEALTPEQKKAVEQVIQDYFLKHPEFMVDVLRAAEAKLKDQKAEDAKQAISERRDELLGDASAPIGGNPDGDVTIVEFFDYRCPYCKAMAEPLQALVKKDGKLRLVLKEFPILGPNSTLASKASIGARPQGRYLAFHEALLTHKGDLDDKAITAIARGLGIDTGKMKARAEDPQVTAKLARNLDLGRALELDGTPAFIIGDTLIPGAVDLEMLEQAIAEARKKS